MQDDDEITVDPERYPTINSLLPRYYAEIELSLVNEFAAWPEQLADRIADVVPDRAELRTLFCELADHARGRLENPKLEAKDKVNVALLMEEFEQRARELG
jgi:hypothetical protein